MAVPLISHSATIILDMLIPNSHIAQAENNIHFLFYCGNCHNFTLHTYTDRMKHYHGDIAHVDPAAAIPDDSQVRNLVNGMKHSALKVPCGIILSDAGYRDCFDNAVAYLHEYVVRC